jgi:hypothetical protein
MVKTIRLLGLLALASAAACSAETMPLTAITGTQIGFRSFDYRYEEEVRGQPFMSLTGSKSGIVVDHTRAFGKDLFWRVEGSYALGWLDYWSNGTGTKSGERSEYLDVRATLGKDFPGHDMVFAPYAGLGYRQLRHDGREHSFANGHEYHGYRRVSDYAFVPLGAEWRIRAAGDTRLVFGAEWDFLLKGKQRSYYTDGGADSDAINIQHSGRGTRLQARYEWPRWSAGLYYQRWDIDDSDRSVYQDGGETFSGREPRNTTTEIGLQVSMRF